MRKKQRVKRQYNPWAVCNAQAKKYDWSKAKKERCIKHVKKGQNKYKKFGFKK